MTAIASATFVAFDLETTGLSAVQDRIVEVGAVRFNSSQSEWQTFSQLVNPLCRIPTQVIAVHGITDDMVENEPVLADVLPEFLSFIDGAILVAHNAHFDLGFLSYALQRMGDELPAHLVIDTCRLSRKVFPQAPNHKLATLVNFLGVATDAPYHRALADSKACAHIFLKCISRLPQKEQTDVQELLKRIPEARSDFYHPMPEGEGASGYRRKIIDAIGQQQSLTIRYRNVNKQETERQITPVFLGGHGAYSYLEAYCHLRQEQRQFRLDRIVEIGL